MFPNIVVVLILITAQGVLSMPCLLDDSRMNKSWVFRYGNDILHSDYLDDQTTLDLICNETHYVSLPCRNGFLEPLPVAAGCSKRFRASVVDTNTTCGSSNMQGKMYEVRYDWTVGRPSVLYETCYSHTDEAVLYARHLAYGFNLPATKYKRPQFTQDRVVSGERATSFLAANIYSTFNTLLGPGQTHVTSATDYAVQRGHLANSQDFLTYDQMDETFKYVNVMPNFRGSNNGNWNKIENWIHKLPSKRTYASVVTGMYGILHLPHSQPPHQMIPMYLINGTTRNPIPMWTYKLVVYNNICYAFVTLNNDSNTNSMITTNICQPTNCPSGLLLSNINPGRGVSYCCDCAHLSNTVGLH